MYFLSVLYLLESLSSLTYDPYEALQGWPNDLPSLFLHMYGRTVLSDSVPLYAPSLQSPINIRSDLAARVQLPPLQFRNFLSAGVFFDMRNAGHTVEFSIANDSVKVPSIVGGPLAAHGEFQFSKLHVHWGSKNTVGGEHMVNGNRYSMEAHSVHFNKKYGTLKEAKKKSDGLAVVAFFGKIKEEDDIKMKPITDLLPKISVAHSSVKLVLNDIIQSFAELAQPYGYFTYPGSLTSPPYSENVFWIVYDKAIYFSPRQVEAFRNLLSDHNSTIKENARKIQDFNGRPLIYSERAQDSREEDELNG